MIKALMSTHQKLSSSSEFPGQSTSKIYLLHLSSQLLTSGFHPSSSAIIYTIPQRETVAGEATLKSIT